MRFNIAFPNVSIFAFGFAFVSSLTIARLQANESPRAITAHGAVFATVLNPNPPAAPVKLIFIHHSTGENWLGNDNGRLGITLRDNNYFVSDTNYGWGPADGSSGPIGDHTDIGHWYNWFSGPRRDTFMNALFSESSQHSSYARLAADPGGQNLIVMFKSCFPNSQLGGKPGDPAPPISSNPLRGQDSGSQAHTIGNAKGIYIELLNYFSTRLDKLFIVIAAPPLVFGSTDPSSAANARAFNNWLVNDWLASYPHANVFVFDFYNVLTSNGGSNRTNDPNRNDLGSSDGNHHRWYGGAIQHLQTFSNNYSAYGSSADDSHPTAAGGLKASGEFVALLNIAYNRWKGEAGSCALTCTATAPSTAQVNAAVSFAATATPNNCTGSVTFDWNFGDASPHSTASSVSHPYSTAGTLTWTMTASVAGVTCTKAGTISIASGAAGCPQLPLITDLNVYQAPSLAEPPPRIPYRDPVFGTCVVRVTDRTHDLDPSDGSTGLKNEYSRAQAFNANETRILARGIHATWYLYDAQTLQPIGMLPFGGSVDPRWDASNPDILYYSEETRLMRFNTRTSQQNVVHDFAADFPGQRLATVWTRYEGSPSLDGRYWGFMAQDDDSHVLAFLVYDQKADKVIAKRDMRGVAGVDQVDSVTISPLGYYFVAQFDFCPEGGGGTDAKPCGLMVYNMDLTNGRGLHRIIGHSDLALDAQRREVMVYQNNDTDNISMIDLATGANTDLWSIDFSHTSIGLHFSGRANLLPGWAVVSTHDSDPKSYTWMDEQVFAIELKAKGRLFRLAHTHSLVDGNQEHDYWAEPQASTNRDMTRVLFTTNWGRSGTGQVEMYMIHLPYGWASDNPPVNPAGSIVFPRLATNSESGSGPDSSEYIGIAVINLSSTPATLTFSAFDTAGAMISGPNITNPSSIPLNPGGQTATIDFELLGNGLPAKKPVGWLSLASGVRQVVGFFLMFNGSATILDGADVSSTTMTSFVLPEIEEKGINQIHVANPSANAAAITFELYGPDGKLRTAAVTRNINARGTVAEHLTSLFPGVSLSGSDYVKVASNRGVVGFEYLGKIGQYAESLNGQDTAAGATSLYSPQYAVGEANLTTLSIVNLDSVPGTVTLRLIQDNGTQLGRRDLPIPAKGKIFITDQKFFLDPGSSLTQGYVEITSSGPKLTGSVVFGDPSRIKYSASLPLVSTPLRTLLFSHVVSSSSYWTGLALLNFNNADATTNIEVFNQKGERIGSKTEVIPAGRRISQLVTNYIPSLAGQKIDAGYIKVTSDRAIAGFALFGTSDLSVLAAIPPQAIP